MRSFWLIASLLGSVAFAKESQWRYDLKSNASGIVALEAIVVSPTLVIWFDRASDDPLQVNNHSAWGAIWDLQTSSVRPLDVFSNSFCASGALISNGSMVSIGGDPAFFDGNPGIHANGNVAVRIFEPCSSPTGEGCTLFDNPQTLHLSARRWYPSAIRIFDGSLFIAGGMHELTHFYNTDPENTFEFFPPKDGGALRPSKFLEASLPTNLFPRTFALPDGRIFMVAGNKTAIYDIEADTETMLPDIPNGVQVTNPADGSAILLPLSPPHYVPEVLVCGGIAFDIRIPSDQLNSQDPATTQCSRMVVTPEGIARGWQVEHMLEPRIMPELVHVPNGQVLIINGGRTGYAAISSVGDPAGHSNADHAVLTPALYTPQLPRGSRISNIGMPTTSIARLYHSSVTLTPQGNFLVAGSNPNNRTFVGPTVVFPSEFRVETLDPPYMSAARPVILNFPAKLRFGARFTVPVSIPRDLVGRKIQLSLMDLGFSSHAFHSGARLVFMDATLSRDRRSLSFTTPPNGRVYPPGPAFVFLTVDDATSESKMVMMGSGRSPPTLE